MPFRQKSGLGAFAENLLFKHRPVPDTVGDPFADRVGHIVGRVVRIQANKIFFLNIAAGFSVFEVAVFNDERIYDKGIEILVGSRTPELTLAENPLMDERSVTNLKSNDSLKQEVKTNFY